MADPAFEQGAAMVFLVFRARCYQMTDKTLFVGRHLNCVKAIN